MLVSCWTMRVKRMMRVMQVIMEVMRVIPEQRVLSGCCELGSVSVETPDNGLETVRK